MRVVVCGDTPAGLTASAALAREGHDVTLVGTHGTQDPEFVYGNVSVLARRGLFGSVPIEKLGAEPLNHHEFLFSDGKEYSGFSSQLDDGTSLLLERSKLVRWLRRMVRDAGVTDRSQSSAGALIRRDDRVQGVWTNDGPVEADVVYLAEGAFSWLTRQEGYHRVLPGDDPDYLLNLQKQYTVSGDERVSRSLAVKPGTITTIVLPTAPTDPPVSSVLRLTRRDDRLVTDLMVPYKGFRESITAPDELVAWVESLPLFQNLPVHQERSSAEASLRLPGGRSRWTTFCDHGLAVGGVGSGTSCLFPGADLLGGPLHGAYQFSRGLSHMERNDGSVSRRNLESHYQQPIEEGPHGSRARRSDPWVDLLIDGQASLSGIAPVLATGTLEENLTVSNLLDLLKQVQSADWSLPSPGSIVSLGRDLPRSLFGSVASGSKSSPISSSSIGWASKLVLEGFHRAVPVEGTSGSAERLPGEPVRSLTTIVKFLGRLASDSTSPVDPEGSSHVADPSPRESTSTALGPGPNLLTGVGSSLNEGVDAYGRLESLCPADVFELTGEAPRCDFLTAPERCTECGICRFGAPDLDFVGGATPSGSPEGDLTGARESLYGSVHSHLREEDLRILRTARSRLQELTRTLAEDTYLTPDARRWVQGQLNLVRGDLRNLDVPDEVRSYHRDLVALIDRIRRALAGDRYRYTHQLLQKAVGLYLPSPESSSSTPREPDVIVDDNGRSTTNDPTPGDRLEDFTNRLEERFRKYYGPLRGFGDRSSIALVLPGDHDHLVCVGATTVQEVLVPQEGGFWTVETEKLNMLGSLTIKNDLELRRYEVIGTTADPSPNLDYGESLEPFGDLLLELQRDFLGDITALHDAESSPGRARGPDELLPVAYLDALSLGADLVGHGGDVRTRAVILDLLARQEMLLGPDYGGLESVSYLREASSTGRNRPGEFARLLQLLVGSIDELSNEVLAHDLTSMSEPDPLGLSGKERERWEQGDTGGIVDDSVRQWRTALGELRQVSGEGGDRDPLETGILTARLWTTRHLIKHVQERLREGGSPRRDVLRLDLLMRRLYESRQRPDTSDRHPLQSSSQPDGTVPDASMLSRAIDRLKQRLTIPGSGSDARSVKTFYHSLLSSLTAESSALSPSSVRRITVLLVEADRTLDVLEETFLRGRLLCVHERLGRYVSQGTYRTGDSGEPLLRSWNESLAQLRETFTEGLYGDSFRRRVRSLTGQFQEELPIASDYFEEDTDRESLERALELFSPPLSRALQSRANLHSLYVQYVRMLAEMVRLSKASDPEGSYEDWVRRRVVRRSKGLLRSSSSLFVHGAREAGDGIEPPEAQVKDLLSPETIFPRRYRSLG